MKETQEEREVLSGQEPKIYKGQASTSANTIWALELYTQEFISDIFS